MQLLLPLCVLPFWILLLLTAYCKCVAVREESSFAVNSVRESPNESLNHSNDSVGSSSDIAEFSDEEDIPSGKYFTRDYFAQ